jgi:hypothetical protein
MRAAAALLLLALTLTGCETNIERSAQLKHAHHDVAAQKGLVIEQQSRYVKVIGTTVLHDENGIAAVVTLRNDSTHPLREVPVAITLHSAGGETLYQNDIPGLSAPLAHAPLLMPGQRFNWIDDQIQASGTPGALSVRLGEAPTAEGQPPSIAITGVHLSDDPTNGIGAEGTVVNHSSVPQEELVVFAIGRRDGRIVAAGRAILPNVPAHSSTPFQVFFIGNPKGASLELSAPPTTPG